MKYGALIVTDAGVPIYSISAVERMVGVPAATLRNWEERYGLIQPQRSPGGHRLYSRDQVEQIRFLAAQVEQGLQPAEAHRLLGERLDPQQGAPARASETEPTLLILLAERDPYAADFVDFFLRTEGYEVAIVFSAEEAERVHEQRSPQLAIVELLISGGAGARLCRRLKERNGATACIAISSLDAREQALEAGADAFLQKPLDPLRLVSTAKDLLGTSAYLAPRARPSA
jgi:DNA-binding transcriptional MerR regulator